MAINLTDFDKIWASSSPLTPYSFSDANYEEGWNFVGSTPPARQMWDSYMKWSDEKQQYIVQNFLPLSGGTMTGAITVSAVDFIKRNVNDSHLTIMGGTTYGSSASLRLAGGDETSQTGLFQLSSQDGNGAKDLVGKTDGTLTWGGSSVVTLAGLTQSYASVSYTLASNTSAESTADVSKTGKTVLGIIGVRTYSQSIVLQQFWLEGTTAHIWLRNIGTSSVTQTMAIYCLYANN